MIEASPAVSPHRDFLICTLYSGGETLQAIGDRFGLTRERVRQICVQHGMSRNHTTRIDPFRVVAAVHDSASIREIAQKLGYPEHSVRRVLRTFVPTAIDELAAYRHEAVRERALAKIRALATRLDRPVGISDFIRYGPSPTLLVYLFGAVSKAVRLAGLPAAPSGYHGHRKRFLKTRTPAARRNGG